MTGKGAVYHHSKFIFEDGETGKKYIILLNSPVDNDPFVFVKVTSQPHHRTKNPGCQEQYDTYFIKAGPNFFWEDTWVQLYHRYIIRPQDIKNNPEVTYQTRLDDKIVEDIIDCLFKCQEEDMPPLEMDLIRPSVQQGLLKLQEKFNTGKR